MEQCHVWVKQTASELMHSRIEQTIKSRKFLKERTKDQTVVSHSFAINFRKMPQCVIIEKHSLNLGRNQTQYLNRVCWRISTIGSCLRSRLWHLMAVVISSICRICSLQCKKKLKLIHKTIQSKHYNTNL
jgi:hypothetical protein